MWREKNDKRNLIYYVKFHFIVDLRHGNVRIEAEKYFDGFYRRLQSETENICNLERYFIHIAAATLPWNNQKPVSYAFYSITHFTRACYHRTSARIEIYLFIFNFIFSPD